jgi:uncharacterized membrane protein
MAPPSRDIALTARSASNVTVNGPCIKDGSSRMNRNGGIGIIGVIVIVVVILFLVGVIRL